MRILPGDFCLRIFAQWILRAQHQLDNTLTGCQLLQSQDPSWFPCTDQSSRIDIQRHIPLRLAISRKHQTLSKDERLSFNQQNLFRSKNKHFGPNRWFSSGKIRNCWARSVNNFGMKMNVIFCLTFTDHEMLMVINAPLNNVRAWVDSSSLIVVF